MLHGLHAVDPKASWNVPAAHAVHSDKDLRAEGVAEYVPGAQADVRIGWLKPPLPHPDDASAES